MKNYILLVLLILALTFSTFTTSTHAQSIRINEIGTTVDFEGTTTWVELKNTGSSTVDVSNLIFCSQFNYPPVGSQPILFGNSDYTIPPDGFLVVEASTISNGNDEMGLYEAGTGDFGNSNNIIDYVMYNGVTTGRDGVADEAGIWIDGEFVPSVESTQTFSFFEDGTDNPVDNWKAGSPTPGEANEEATTTDIDDVTTVADEFQIIGNFPNPFNPTTTIQFNLPSAATVSVQIYNILGSEVMRINAGRFSAGSANQIVVNAQNLSSGTYFYRLIAQTNSEQLRVSDSFTLIK